MKLAVPFLVLCGCAGGARMATSSMPESVGERAGAGPDAPALARAGVAAGEWDDNANYREFQRFLDGQRGLGFHALDVRDRQFLVVRDAAGKGVPGCRVQVVDADGHGVALTTLSSGRALLFPHAEGLVGSDVAVSVACAGGGAQRHIALVAGEGVHLFDLPSARALAGRPLVDIAFALDTTGSMAEEIEAVKETIRQVAAGLGGLDVTVRLGLVEYKDRGDSFVTRVYPFTDDLGAFARSIDGLQAAGGGDTPESVNAGLHAAITRLPWSSAAAARITFLVGDAPPHLDYAQDESYTTSARLAARAGIQVFTVAASGMDLLGQVVFRQVAQYTGATNLFVLRGGAGPQSTGAGDPRSSCGGTQTAYTSGNLDALLIDEIRGAIAALDADPMPIAGFGMDENAKPCAARVASP